LDKPFVLLAEDNEATCTLMTALLQGEFTVEIARDGGEAIEKLRNHRYSAILLDLRMPVVDGYAVLDFLRAERPDLLSTVLVVTAALAARELTSVRSYEVCGIIPKPFEIDALLTAVRECAGTNGMRPYRSPMVSGGMLLLLAEVLRRV
jgi:CheY-like chemotaxis protein